MKERNTNYDLIRVIAIVLVLLCHSLEIIYFGRNNLSIKSELFYTIFHTVSRLGVPLFLFLSGALLLKRNFENINDIKKFYKHNFLTLLVVCEIWYVFYYILDIMVFKRNIPVQDFIPTLLFIKPYPLSHAWYLPVIIGIYLTIPFLSIIVRQYEKYIKYIMYINIAYVFIIPMLNIIFKFLNISYYIENKFSIPFAGDGYGIYLLLGYYISKNYNNEQYNKKKNNFLLIIILILSFIITVFIRYRLRCDSWYNMFTILICSSSMFILLLRLKIVINNTFLYKLSVCSFGVYLIHKLIIDIINKLNFINDSDYILPIKALLYFNITFIISYMIVILASKIKYLRKYLLFIKD